MKDKLKLKPCPFCGCDDARVQVETYGKWARVFCPPCGASTMSLPCGSFDPTPAAMLWNKRVENDKPA